MPVTAEAQQDPPEGVENRGSETGPAHQRLAQLAGEWVTRMRVRPQPEAEPVESAGTARITATLGGRFLLEESKGLIFGRETTTLRWYGFNNATRKYEATWVYDQSTAILLLTGQSAREGKIIDLEIMFLSHLWSQV